MATLSEKEYEQLIGKAQAILVEDEPSNEDLARAEQYIDEALADDPEDEFALCLKIMALREQDRLDDAMRWVEKAEPHCDDNAFYTEKAMVLMEKAEELLHDVVEACEKAIECAEEEKMRKEIDEEDSLEFITAATAYMMLHMNDDDDQKYDEKAEDILLQGLDFGFDPDFRAAIKDQLDEFGFDILEE